MELQYSSLYIISSLILFLLFLFKLFKEFERSSTQNLPPGPWKLPIIGNIFHLAGMVQTRGLRDLANKHGPIMHLQLGEISAIVISSARLAKEVLKTHDLAFASRPKILASKIVMPNGKDMVFSVYDDYWRQMRKLCTVELLTANKVSSFRSNREDEAWDLVNSIRSNLGSSVNLTEKFSAFTNGVTCRAAIGKRCEYQDEIVKCISDIASLGGGFYISDLFPSIKLLHVLSGMKPKLQKIRLQLDEIFDNIIRQHAEKRARAQKGDAFESVDEEEDLVDVLLRLQEKGGLQFPILYDDIQGVVLTMLTAGTDTSSAVLEWAMSELIKNPRVMEKLQTEIRQALKGKTTINETDIKELSYLKLVIKETLRLYPPVPLLLPRECREECNIDGYHIPVKTKVIVNAWAMGRDPEYWGVDAGNFIPERFESVSADFFGSSLNYIPFGAGRRMCPGITFGLASVELPLALLLYYFNWKLPNGMKPESLEMNETLGATLKRKHNLSLIATPFISSEGSS